MSRAKDLEETVESMDADYKARITELEAWGSATTPEQCEERTKELKAFSATIALRLEDTQKLLDDTTSTWVAMEEIEDLVVVWEALQKNQ